MSVKFFEKALASLKKANKDAKLKKAINAGYSTVEEYKEFLETQIKSAAPVEVVEFVEAPKAKKKTEKKETGPVEIKSPEQLTDMVIAFDVTSSMDRYRQSVKNQVTDLIPNLFKENPNLKISIVAFGDYCDMKSRVNFGNAYQVINLSDNQEDLIAFVNKATKTSGGDYPEFYELVIKKITEETEWREDSNKSVLFIADATPHPLGYSCSPYVRNNQIDWKEEAKKAGEKGIKFDTLRIDKYVTWYEELSSITGGVCLDFQSSKKTSQLVEATVLARGGEITKKAFLSKSMSSEVTADAELNSVYSMYKSVIDK